MRGLKILRTALLSSVYGLNLFLALCLWLCGQSGNIMLGILLIAFYRLSLWFSPVILTAIYWMPWRPTAPLRKKLLLYFVHLCLCALLYVTCFLLFGHWF